MHASFGYNSRLQLETLGYTNGGTLFGLTYDYHLGVNNNGQIRKITDNVDSGRTVNYTYDELGRLKTAVTDGSTAYPQWGLKWSYDRYGNRTNQEVTAGGGPNVPLTFDTPKNRISISGVTYDGSGNLLQDGTYAYKYDAENRAVDYGAGGATYGFDGNGLRVRRTYGATTVYIFSGSQVIAEYASGAAPTSPTREYIYAGGLLASIESGTTKYYYPDHLSTRMTMAGGTTTQQGHYPFGENWYGSTEKWKFTSYERGDENGNDYAMFRSYISRYGRFQTPDPAGAAAVDPRNPQTWNRYGYVRNNVTNAIDPLGLVEPGACNKIDPEPWCYFLKDLLKQIDCFFNRNCGPHEPPLLIESKPGGGTSGGTKGGSDDVQKPQPKKPDPAWDKACPGDSFVISLDGSFSLFFFGLQGSTGLGFNGTGLTVTRGAGTATGTPQFNLGLNVGHYDVGATEGTVDFYIQKGEKRFSASIPYGTDPRTGRTLVTGELILGAAIGEGRIPSRFSLQKTTGNAGGNYCVSWSSLF